MEVTVRSAKKEDITAVFVLENGMHDYHVRLDSHYAKRNKAVERFLKKSIRTRFRDPRSRIMVAIVGDKIVGCTTGVIEKPKVYMNAKRIGWVERAFVKEGYRRKGIAKLMLRETLKWFRKHRIKSVYLIVHARNTPALKLWKRTGFRDFRKEMRIDL